MKATVHETTDTVTWRGKEYTVWIGETEAGVPVQMLVGYMECTDKQRQLDYRRERLLSRPGMPIPRGIPDTDIPYIEGKRDDGSSTAKTEKGPVRRGGTKGKAQQASESRPP
ncbi:hypothetical protein [Schlesneria sp.]|uniref:hypothetical protein n=1 Tax=Schlesneria sp. TaxID=2762018 RepID=UPI002EF7B659